MGLERVSLAIRSLVLVMVWGLLRALYGADCSLVRGQVPLKSWLFRVSWSAVTVDVRLQRLRRAVWRVSVFLRGLIRAIRWLCSSVFLVLLNGFGIIRGCFVRLPLVRRRRTNLLLGWLSVASNLIAIASR